jgi:hypothetical protein
MKKPPGGGSSVRAATYFEAAFIAAEAAAFADCAASIADDAADIAEPIAAEAAPVSAGGVVTTVVVDGVVAGGVVVVVVVSSFLLHAANETAAAKVTINSAVFMFLLDIKVRQLTGLCGNLLAKSPIVRKPGSPERLQCLADDYRHPTCFP